MPHFAIKQTGLFSSYHLNRKEEEKLNRFLVFLENSGVGELIHRECYKDHSKGGRPPYDYYNLFAASIYAFSKHPGTLRKIEDSHTYDVRFMYLMDNEVPSYAKIGGFLNSLSVKAKTQNKTAWIRAVAAPFFYLILVACPNESYGRSLLRYPEIGSKDRKAQTMNVPKCPLCGTELFGRLCPICGFEAHRALNLDPWPFDGPKDPSDPFADPLAPLLFCDPSDDSF